ncbi:MAG: hypothetical protein SPJ97_02690 [Bacteroides sp.]|nr:hypothetical protein [Bacteroides sp.]
MSIRTKKNPFASKPGGKKPSGKRIGKSRPEKANNQLNRRVK